MHITKQQRTEVCSAVREICAALTDAQKKLLAHDLHTLDLLFGSGAPPKKLRVYMHPVFHLTALSRSAEVGGGARSGGMVVLVGWEALSSELGYTRTSLAGRFTQQNPTLRYQIPFEFSELEHGWLLVTKMPQLMPRDAYLPPPGTAIKTLVPTWPIGLSYKEARRA